MIVNPFKEKKKEVENCQMKRNTQKKTDMK